MLKIRLNGLSKENFLYLEVGEQRIIGFIAEFGPMSITQIGEKTKRFANGFDRWGVRKRLEGSWWFKGLIKQDYVYEFKINKKESRYGLTVKGLLAALRFRDLEKIYLVREYVKFLKKYTRDVEKLKLIFKYIQFEIAFLLYHNLLQGVDWTRFRYLKAYLRNRRANSTYPDNFLDLEIEPYYWKDPVTGRDYPEPNHYTSLRDAYLRLHQQCYEKIGFEKAKEVYDKLIIKKNTSQQIKSKIMEVVILNIGTTLWYEYIDSFELSNKTVDMVEDYLQINAKDPYQYWPRAIRGNEVKDRILSIAG